MLIILGLLIVGFALSPHISVSCVFLFLAGAVLVSVFALISSLVQLITTHEMRGRIMSVYNVAFRGGMPIGSLVTGAAVPLFGAPACLAVNGLLLSLLGAYFLLVHRRIATL